MAIDLKAQYREKSILKARWRRAAREGTLESVVPGPMIARNPAELNDSDLIAGADLTEPQGIFLTSIANHREGTTGGRTTMARLDVAAERIIFNPGCFREATPPEIEKYNADQQARLDERISAGRNLSRREDSKYGRKD